MPLFDDKPRAAHEPVFGPPPYSRVIVATLGSIEDMMAIGGSELIQSSKEATPEGMQVVFYQYGD